MSTSPVWDNLRCVRLEPGRQKADRLRSREKNTVWLTRNYYTEKRLKRQGLQELLLMEVRGSRQKLS